MKQTISNLNLFKLELELKASFEDVERTKAVLFMAQLDDDRELATAEEEHRNAVIYHESLERQYRRYRQ
jgi:hypothetical protein